VKDKVLIFGGTTEGRELAAILSDAGVLHAVSVATEYGKDIEYSFGEKNVIVGRKSSDEMAELIKKEAFNVCVDATHPFATVVSDEIKRACENTGIIYLRLLRDTESKVDIKSYSDDKSVKLSACDEARGDNCYGNDFCKEPVMSCDSVEEAVAELERNEGKILLLTGSKDLKVIMAGISDKSRVYARVLPNTESISKCEEAGLKGKQIIAMQGPFSRDMNCAFIKETGASVILTKESGATGGLDDKITAALECGIKVVIIRNPERAKGSCDKTYSLQDILKKLGIDEEELCVDTAVKSKDSDASKHITLAGIGPGDSRYYTKELESAIAGADVIFGAKSVLERLDKSGIKAHLKALYMGRDILEFLEKSDEACAEASSRFKEQEFGAENIYATDGNAKYRNPLALFSGDISLCSGAKNAAKVFEDAGYCVCKISGISSVALFANRVGISLEDCDIVSAHGRECNVVGYISDRKQLIILPSSCAHAGSIVRQAFAISKADDAGSIKQDEDKNVKSLYKAKKRILNDNLRIVLGYELGTVRERIIELTYEELAFCESVEDCSLSGIFSDDEKGKCLLYIENKNAGKEAVIKGITDDEFIRGKTPMTKEEIRAISIRKLGLFGDSVLYDIGAGTGSVSVEAALLHPDIKVFSIEKNDEALELLKKNKEKFCAENMTVVKGKAPEALKELPVPTHAFIGGSGGELKSIIRLLKKKNPDVKIVINCITLETITEVLSTLKDGEYTEPDIVQVSANRYRKVGNYHMPDAINPVYIVTL